MSILDKVPGVSGFKMYKEGVEALAYTNAVKIIESGYKKGRQKHGRARNGGLEYLHSFDARVYELGLKALEKETKE